jgi:ketosteroid isomerase-like protein
VSGIIGRWSAAFNRLDAATLASLYSRNAFFFGSKSQLDRGHEGVAAYFNALPRWVSPTVHRPGDGAGQSRFDQLRRHRDLRRPGRCRAPLSVKITWVIAREDGDWKIASHHVSSQTPLL